MMAASRGSRRGLVWALVGGLVLVAGIVASIIAALSSQTPLPMPTGSTSAATPTMSSNPGSSQAVVDESVSERGWVAEPITTDPEEYVRAALAAASTFDTQLSGRAEWLASLDSWFTPDTRYTSEQDRLDDVRASQLELRQAVVLPEEAWDSLAAEGGRVRAAVDGVIDYTEVPDDTSGEMRIGTGDVVLTFTRSDGSGGETSYDEVVRVSVQVLCGAGSVPTPDTAQAAGDCKVVRYFSGSLEP